MKSIFACVLASLTALAPLLLGACGPVRPLSPGDINEWGVFKASAGRDGQFLKGHQAFNDHQIVAGTSIDEAVKVLGPGTARANCKVDIDGKSVPCLRQTVTAPEFRITNIYYFPDARLRHLVVYVTPSTADGSWFKAPPESQTPTKEYCDQVGLKLLNFLKADFGEPEPVSEQQLNAESDRFPTGSKTAKLDARGGFHTLTTAGQFTFPAGGRIVFERTLNTDGDECQVRAIFDFAD